MSKIKLSKDFIRNTVKRALNEDLYPTGDITSSLVKNNKIIKIKLLSNENAIVGGLLFVKQAFDLVDNKIKFNIKKKDGSIVKKGSLIANIEGLSLIHISEPTRRTPISYAVFCLKKVERLLFGRWREPYS